MKVDKLVIGQVYYDRRRFEVIKYVGEGEPDTAGKFYDFKVIATGKSGTGEIFSFTEYELGYLKDIIHMSNTDKVDIFNELFEG